MQFVPAFSSVVPDSSGTWMPNLENLSEEYYQAYNEYLLAQAMKSSSAGKAFKKYVEMYDKYMHALKACELRATTDSKGGLENFIAGECRFLNLSVPAILQGKPGDIAGDSTIKATDQQLCDEQLLEKTCSKSNAYTDYDDVDAEALWDLLPDLDGEHRAQ